MLLGFRHGVPDGLEGAPSATANITPSCGFLTLYTQNRTRRKPEWRSP
jgi:hypothetical protein